MPARPRHVPVLVSALLAVGLVAQDAAERALARKLEITPQKEYHAVLMRALTWLTGGAEENDYVSVGRLANYFGFVRFRVSSRHSLSRGAVGQETYALLVEAQRRTLAELLDAQWPALVACKEARVRINRALEGMLVGRPADLAQLEDLGARFGEAEAELGRLQAEGFARIVAKLTAAQRQGLQALRERALAGQLGQVRLTDDERSGLRRLVADFDGLRQQEFWNLASRLCSWVTGTPVDNDYDTVGKPSQHFGDVELRIESGHGATRGGVAHEVEGLLTADQRRALRMVVEANSDDWAAYAKARAAIDRALECGLVGKPIDAAVVRREGRAQGVAEARMTWRHAMAFLQLRDGLDADQAGAFVALRSRLVLPPVEGAPSAGDGAATALDGDKLVLAGERLFAVCALCHAPSQGRGIGPSLRGVIGRTIGSVDGFRYSSAMQARGQGGEVWTMAALDGFLANPQRHTPGTIMGFSGLPSADQREALLAFLATFDGGAPKAGSQVVGEPVVKATANDGKVERTTSPRLGATQDPKPAGKTAKTGAMPTHPNFVFVQFEGTGAGWASTSVAMDDRRPEAKAAAARTPQLAALAKEGMRFAEFYATAPRCTPTRASFLTGVGAAKLGMTYVNEGGQERRGAGGGAGEGGRRGRNGERDTTPPADTKLVSPSSVNELPEATTTIAELLRAAGYRSAHFGKWHVGRSVPSVHGFDEHDGANTNQGPGRDPNPNPEQAVAITDRGLAFAKAQQAAGKPFFLQLSHYGGGSEEEARPETRQAMAAEVQGRRAKDTWQAAILHDIDSELGRLLAGLAQAGLADSTYVLVSFDHGAAGRDANAPLRGGKGSVLEGGIRVPFLVRGPGVAAGVCSHVRASACDLLPTLAELAGIAKWPSEVEGGSLAGVLRGRGVGVVARPREEFVVHFPHYDLQNGGPASAIFVDDWKLIRSYETGSVQLFDVSADPEERRDRAAAEPKVVADLQRRLDAYLRAIDAGMPTPKPAAADERGK